MTRYAPTRSLVNSTPDFPNGLTVSLGNVGISGSANVGGTINGIKLRSTAYDNFQLYTYTNTPNPNITISYGDGAGNLDYTREYLLVNSGSFDFMNAQMTIQGKRTTDNSGLYPWVQLKLRAKNTDISSMSGAIGTVAGSASSWTANLTVVATSALHVGMKVTSTATGTTAGAVGTGAVIQSITSATVAVIFSTTTSTAGSSTYSFTDSGGISWSTYADTLSDTKITGARQYTIWGYPERTDTGAVAKVSGGTAITERFFDLSFPTYNEVYTTGVYQYSTYSMLAQFYVPVSINGHLRLRAPQSTSPQGWAGAMAEGRLTIESQTTTTASSQGSIAGTVMTTSGAVTGAWAAGQVLSGTGVVSGTVVTNVSGTTVNLDIDNGTVSSTTMTGTPLIWNIDSSSGLFRIFREDWRTDTTYGGGPNGAVRLAITNAGKVGIGTTSPGYTLDVSGTARVSGGMAIGTTVDNDVPLKIGIVTATGQIGLHLTSTTGSHLQLTDSGNVDMSLGVLDGQSALSFHTGRNRVSAGTELMRLTSAGYMGIGTTSPGALLDIQGSIESLYLLRANGANSNAPNLRIRKSRGTSASKSIIVNGDYLGHITWEGYDGANFIEGAGIYGISNGTVAIGSVPSDLTFYTNPGSMSQGPERMRISSTGKITIGPLQTGTALSLVNPPLSVTAWSYAPYAGFANKILLWDGGGGTSDRYGFGISGGQLDYLSGGAHVFYIVPGGSAASFTGSIPSNSAILTVSAIASGTIAPFQEIYNAAGLPSGLIIIDQLTSTEAASALGGKGTYTVSSTQSLAVTGISMQTVNARYERMRINSAGVRMTLPTAPTVGQVLAATDTSGTLGWSSGTTYYRQFMFTS